MCIGEEGNGRWLQVGHEAEAPTSGPGRSQCLHILRTCMRLLVVNVAQVTPQTPADPEMRLENSLHYLRTSIMNLAELSCGPQADKLLLSTCEEAGNALVAGFDVFFPDTEQQAALVIDLLGRAEHSRILRALAMQMSKPGAHNLLFAIFDGTWLAGGEERVAMAHKLLLLLFEKVVSSPQIQKDEEMADLGVEEDGISHSTLLHLLAAFQRNLFSVPLSAQRSTRESEDLLFFYARCLIDHAIRAVEAVMDQEGDVTLSSPFVRRARGQRMEPEPQLEHRQRASPLLAGLPADRREVQLQQGDGEAPGPRLLSQVDREPLSCWEDGLDPACAALAAGGGQDAGGREHDRAHQRGRGAEQEGDAADPQGPRVGEQQLEHDQGQPPREAAVALVQGAGRHGLPDVHADRALARRAQGLEAHPLQRLR
eukprot:2137560-Rhodomonas_salina.1